VQNIKATVTGSTLTIVIDLSQTQGASKSGKSIIIATTSGNQAIAPGVMLGLNCYKKQ
jgi:hypothetical protein